MWSSHIPINRTLLEVFDVTGVMELGMGKFSTVLFNRLAPYVVSIENDVKWIETMKEGGIVQTPTHKIVHHDLTGTNVRIGTSPKAVSESVKQKANAFYKKHLTDNINYLFIDCFTGLRASALMGLYDMMDIVVWHDADLDKESKIYGVYGYEKFINHPGYLKYHDCSYTPPWTGFLIKEDLMDDDKYKQIVETHSKHWRNHVAWKHKEALNFFSPKIRKG